MPAELWTELEYAAAAKRYRELRRQRRWKEAGALLGHMQKAVEAELGRATVKAKITACSRNGHAGQGATTLREFEPTGTGVAPLLRSSREGLTGRPFTSGGVRHA